MSPRSARDGVACAEDILIEKVGGNRIGISSTRASLFQGQDKKRRIKDIKIRKVVPALWISGPRHDPECRQYAAQ